MIRLEGVHKFFNKGRPNEIHVINDVSLDLPERGMVAIFGKSGCGKTTLLNVIGGLDSFAEGTLTVEGQSIGEDTDGIRNRHIGYIFQNYNLHKDRSCFDNVADALYLCGMTDGEEIERRVTLALSNVGMEKYARRTPDTLSGGQQQRIAIARAIVKNPRIILADEPTGNLDEANTVMIMDLLKVIAKDHLVLLVTHEENLVDYYCDTVIELEDGRVVGMKENANAGGYTARDKNDIYLGELAHTALADENAEISYFGDKPQTPIKLKIVNSGGKIYVQIDTDKVRVLDSASEIRLREGVYTDGIRDGCVDGGLDMVSLPPVEGARCGRLFSFRSSLVSGFLSNFKRQKKGKTVLCACLCLFAIVTVFISAVFGSAFGDILDARAAYNHNVFYLYTPNEQVSAALNEAVGRDETGIDFIRLMYGYPTGDTNVVFHTGVFETFSQYDWANNFETNAVYLDVSLAADMRLVEGKKDALSLAEVVITTKVADALLEKSTLGYITEREDLLGLAVDMLSIDGYRPRVAGIVESSEPAIYMTPLALAKYTRNGVSPSYTMLASDYGVEVNAGEAILALKYQDEGVEYPKVGDVIQIQGRDIKVAAVEIFYSGYGEWLVGNGIEKVEADDYFANIVRTEHPELDEESEEFSDALKDVKASAHYYEYYDYFWSELGAYCEDLYFFDGSSIELWLYREKGVEDAKYAYAPWDLYKARVYKERYGSYPTVAQLQEKQDELPSAFEAIDDAMALWQEQFYSSEHHQTPYNNTYLVSEADYIAFSKQLGESHPTADRSRKEYADIMPHHSLGALAASVGTDEQPMIGYYEDVYYTVIHSSDPEKTEAWLSAAFADLAFFVVYDYTWEVLVTPDTVFSTVIRDKTEDIVESLVSMVVILTLMSLCMYFIMRSSLMNRIKEIGIYRAIGVSKSNLVFKFLVEALVLTTLTVLVGYLFTGAALAVALNMSSVISQTVYYPLWLAVADLVLLYAISLFFGVLPILTLLRKTPSEILAKYDI